MQKHVLSLFSTGILCSNRTEHFAVRILLQKKYILNSKAFKITKMEHTNQNITQVARNYSK